jgi:hypothetical protein
MRSLFIGNNGESLPGERKLSLTRALVARLNQRRLSNVCNAPEHRQ